MVQKQHSKTSRLFSLKKSSGEASESGKLIQRIASPLGRFHASRNHPERSEVSETESVSESNQHTPSPTRKRTKQSPVEQRKKRGKAKKSLNRLNREKQEATPLPETETITTLLDSSVDSCVDSHDKEKNEISTSEHSESVSYSETSTSPAKDIPKIKTLFRRSLLMPSKEDTPRLTSQEKNIENSRKSFLRGLSTIARKGLELEIRTITANLDDPVQVVRAGSSVRVLFTLACAYHYLACILMADKELHLSEEQARESLSILDRLLLEDPPVDKKRVVTSDYWLTGQDIVTSNVLWIRRATVENQIASIMMEKKEVELALEWFQRSIFSREKRAGVDGLASSYVSISTVLVQSVKDQFNSIKQLLDMSLAVRYKVFFDLTNLLSLAKTYSKTGIQLCKKVVDDSIRINGLYMLMDVIVLQTQISSIQDEYLHGTNTAAITASLTNEKRHKKVEVIRNDIERVQRRLNREKTANKQIPAISDFPTSARRRSVTLESSESIETPLSPSGKPKISVASKSQNSLLTAPVEM